MHIKLTRLVFCSIFLALPFSADAQQPAKVPRIGVLLAASVASQSNRVEAFRQRLRELGYVDGNNIVIEWRHAEGTLEQLPDLAAELVRLKIDVIVATSPAAFAAKKATSTIPIVFPFAGDPVESGLVSSLARPGGNVTGLSGMSPDLNGKRLELLKEAFPKIARVAFLWQSGGTRSNLVVTEMDAVAKELGLKLQSLEVRSAEDFKGAFARAKRDGTHAFLTIPNPLIFTQQRQVLDFVTTNRLPAMYPNTEWVEAGGLMSYAPNQVDMWRRAAEFVDKILKGTKPADIPVEQPMRFDFIINLKTANQLGLKIEPNVLVRANRVIR